MIDFASPRPIPRLDAAFDVAEPQGGGAPELGPLPVWDFSGLYAEPADTAIEEDLQWIAAEAARFAADYEGKLSEIGAEGALGAIERLEAISDRLARVGTYVSLKFQQNMADPQRAKAYGDLQSRYAEITQPLVFFDLEINGLDDALVDGWLAESTGLSRYRPWFDRVRAQRPHQLSNELERFVHDHAAVGSAAWSRLFSQTMTALRFDVSGAGGETETLTLEPTLKLLTDADRSRREAAAGALSKTFGDNIQLFAHITNTLAKQKEIGDRWRKHPTPDHSRHLSNEVEPEVVDALREAVQAAYPRISHRYYALKARWLGLETLQHWDRNAPLTEEDEAPTPWVDARDIVLGAYGEFAPEMATIAKRFFDESWIDAPASPGKAPGAFAHPSATSAHPFVLMNYLGKTRDVMTLAHELGHGVHQVLAAEQGPILSSTPLTLAETASVFGEMLTFRKLLAAADSPERKRRLLASKVEDMINTVVRQIAFYEFERRVHAARRDGELTPEQLGAIWMAVQVESLGPAFEFGDDYANYWAYIPHFVHTPFYVYAYAFGDGLVNALYAVYENAGDDGSFQEAYFDMLRAGGSKRHKALLAPFGLDASDPRFWDKGLDMISGMIDQLEAMES